MTRPELSVIVPSHFRPMRLRWLLNALDAQTLDRSLWEVVVGHDSGVITEQILRTHPLALAGVLSHATQPTGTGIPASNRNVALALAKAPTVVFTDDDCRPPPEWLENVRAAISRHPGAIIQGAVAADPDEAAMLRSAYPRMQHFDDVPRVWGECCNIVYPRAVLDRAGGFYEAWVMGEDTDLLARARRAGVSYVGERAMLTYHAVEEGTLLDWVRGATRWRELPAVIQRNPELRSELHCRIFWKDTHGWLLALLAGLLADRRWPASRRRLVRGLLTLIWASRHPVRPGGARAAARHVAELPGWALIDLAEGVVLLRASVRERVLVL